MDDDDDSDDDQEEEEENVKVNKTTYASLKRAWLAESNAPILLPFKSKVVRRFSNLIEERDAEIDRCERAANDGGDGTEMLLATIGREELNRMKYVLRSYLRTRIEKIQRFPVWSFVQQQVRHVRCGGYIYIYASTNTRAMFFFVFVVVFVVVFSLADIIARV